MACPICHVDAPTPEMAYLFALANILITSLPIVVGEVCPRHREFLNELMAHATRQIAELEEGRTNANYALLTQPRNRGPGG